MPCDAVRHAIRLPIANGTAAGAGVDCAKLAAAKAAETMAAIATNRSLIGSLPIKDAIVARSHLNVL